MTDRRPSDDLEALEARLAEARAKSQPQIDPRAVAGSAFGQGSRLALELVSGVLVGAGIGFFLDRWLGTKPWLMILFFMLGLGAGFMNLIRAVNREAAKVTEDPASLPSVPDDDEERR